jgi:hypothetical protein
LCAVEDGRRMLAGGECPSLAKAGFSCGHDEARSMVREHLAYKIEYEGALRLRPEEAVHACINLNSVSA